MLGIAPRTKETLPNFFLNMDLDKWNTIVCYRVTRNPLEFRRLKDCQSLQEKSELETEIRDGHLSVSK